MSRVVIFTGSRDAGKREAGKVLPIVETAIDDDAWILVGCAAGLDFIVRDHTARVRRLASSPEYPRLRVFVADWLLHGKSAGPMRNDEMVNAAIELAITNNVRIECFAFPARGRSPGTRDCIKRAKEAGATITFPMDKTP